MKQKLVKSESGLRLVNGVVPNRLPGFSQCPVLT